MAKKATPLGDRILVKIIGDKEEKTSSGIIIPDSVKMENVSHGLVISTGDGIFTQNGTLIPMTVKIGDEVIFPPYTGTEVKLDGQEYVIMRESEALLVCK